MTKFLDGPAKDQVLMLKRAPMFLRVVAAHGQFDALDQPEDTPKPEEYIYAYKVEGEPARCHVNRGRNGSGWYAIAEYKFCTDQPPQALLRDTEQWHAWVMAKPEVQQRIAEQRRKDQ